MQAVQSICWPFQGILGPRFSHFSFHTFPEHLEVEDLEANNVRKADGSLRYQRDKRRMVAYAERFAERWKVILFRLGAPRLRTNCCSCFIFVTLLL
jgi:hypothetical protein